jgi:glycosyltransferase involved in cell wall biosynthesis
LSKSTGKSSLFDVVVPTYNNLGHLRYCLDGLKRQTFRRFRVLVCVDGSTDGTLEFLSKAGLPFKHMTLSHPGKAHRGRAASRNLALKHLRSEYLCFLDSDIRPAPGFLEAHLKQLQREDCVSLGEIVYSGFPEKWVSKYLQSRGRGKFRHGDRIPGHYVTTGNAALKAEYFVRLRGFDEGFEMNYGGEDSELGYRLEKSFKLDIIVNKSARGNTVAGKDLSTYLRQMREFGNTNLRYIREKHPELNEIFDVTLLESKSMKAKTIRFFIRKKLCDFLEAQIPLVPDPVRQKVIHFLVFSSIGLGYLSRNTD